MRRLSMHKSITAIIHHDHYQLLSATQLLY
jgi:hypothetical protein